MALQARTPFVLDPRPLEEASSPHAGGLAISRAFRSLGLPELIEANLPLGQRQRGFWERFHDETLEALRAPREQQQSFLEPRSGPVEGLQKVWAVFELPTQAAAAVALGCGREAGEVSRGFSPGNPGSSKTAPSGLIAAGLRRRAGSPQRVAAVGRTRARFRVSVSGAVLPIARISGGRRASVREPGPVRTG